MQATRASAYTALTRIMSDATVDPEVRVQAAIAALSFSSQEQDEAWMFSGNEEPEDDKAKLAAIPGPGHPDKGLEN